jgi:flagellar biosynthetic protein FliO
MGTIQVASGILLVFGLLALFYWLANRLNGGRGFRPGSSRIEIIEARNIGEKRTLLLVRVGGENFLLGATSSQISMLSGLSDAALGHPVDEEIEESTNAPSKLSFRGLLEMIR